MRMSVKEYAAHRGVTRQAVYDAIWAGRITKGADRKIDVERADREWLANTDPGRNPDAGNVSLSPSQWRAITGCTFEELAGKVEKVRR